MSANDVVVRARDVLIERAVGLARSIDDIAPMTCTEVGTERAYGDVVPAGLLLAGLRAVGEEPGVRPAADHLAEWIARRRTTLGFPFHTGTLPTATDTTLTLLGYEEPALVATLQRYADPAGGVMPQLVGVGEGRMVPSPTVAHWLPADDLTTALAVHHAVRAGVVPPAGGDWLAQRASTRASVFVGCPWIVDWAWALAAAATPGADGASLRGQLAAELAASANDDGSYGRADEAPLATAAAAAAWTALGADAVDRARDARRRLGEMVLSGVEPQTPFVSSTRLLAGGSPVAGAPARPGLVMLQAGEHGLAKPGDEVHVLARYRDDSGALFAGVALVALASERSDAQTLDPPVFDDGRIAAHPRYRCATLRDYVERYALPPALDRAGL